MTGEAGGGREEMKTALAAVDLALQLVRSRQGAQEITRSEGRDLSTRTDLAVEDAVRTALSARYPTYGLVGEERGGQCDVRATETYWLLDPICGTRNFASGLPLYAINLALVEAGQVTLSVVVDGATGDQYVAQRGKGAWLCSEGGRRRLRVSEASLTIAVDGGAPGGGKHHDYAAEFMRLVIADNRWYMQMLGTTLTFAYLAAGRVSAYLLFGTSSPVHTAAGCFVATEAGAVVTDPDGRPWDLSSRFIVAASPNLHGELLEFAKRSKEGL